MRSGHAPAGGSNGHQVAELIADDRGHYVDCNEAATELLGYSREELLQMSVWELTPGAEEIGALLLWQEFVRIGFNAGLFRLTRKDGTEIEVRYKAIANVSPGRHLSRLEPMPGSPFPPTGRVTSRLRQANSTRS